MATNGPSVGAWVKIRNTGYRPIGVRGSSRFAVHWVRAEHPSTAFAAGESRHRPTSKFARISWNSSRPSPNT